MQNGSSTPASMPEAMPGGIALTARLNGGSAPVSAISAPQATNAPTASLIEMPLEAAISAAPGVDQASTIGIRFQVLSKAEPMALPKQIAATHEAACTGLAPTACAAASTSAMVEP